MNLKIKIGLKEIIYSNNIIDEAFQRKNDW